MNGQVSLEMITFVGVMIIILTVASFAAVSSASGIRADNEAAAARGVAAVIASEINFAAEIGDGYYHSFTLPDLLRGSSNYTVSAANGFVLISWKGHNYTLPVVSENVSGNVSKGANTVRNINGVIEFD